MQLVRIEPGRFSMGDRFWSRYGKYGFPERHVHEVHITKPFYIGRREVTVEEFRQFVQATGYRTEAERDGAGCNHLDLQSGAVVQKPDCIWSNPGFVQSSEHPVVCVSWQDAVAFCEWLSNSEGRRYRLPTEAEWEYCCRAGTQTTFACGESPYTLEEYANLADQSLQRVFPALDWQAPWDDGSPFTAAVGTRKPNPWGLHDMHGNVGEWCQDWFDADSYADSEQIDPQGPSTPRDFRVVRGGSWYNNANGCRSAGRHDGIPTARSTTNGFRVVLEVNDHDDHNGDHNDELSHAQRH